MKKDIDWEAIEREYRAGQLAIREIGRQFDVTAAAIVQRAKRHNWERALIPKVRKEVNKTLTVNNDVNESHVRDVEVVQAAALREIGVVDLHREDIKKLRTIGQTFMERLEKILAGGVAVDMRVGAGVFRDLAMAMSKYIPLERQAFNIPDTPQRMEFLGKVEHHISPQDRELIKEIAMEKGLRERDG